MEPPQCETMSLTSIADKMFRTDLYSLSIKQLFCDSYTLVLVMQLNYMQRIINKLYFSLGNFAWDCSLKTPTPPKPGGYGPSFTFKLQGRVQDFHFFFFGGGGRKR